jgi:mannose-6-phosphate isomerase-like protein (cupin superfamily)
MFIQKQVEEITQGAHLLAIIIRADHSTSGVDFFTPNSLSQQLAAMGHPKGKIIAPHIHNPVPREVSYTKEVLIIKKGKLRVDFYDDHQNYLESRILYQNDVILLALGGHGFEVLEELQMIEVKQGPYAGDRDKVRFEPIPKEKLNIKDES